MNLVRRVTDASAIAVLPRQSIATAWRLLAASLLFVVALLSVSLGVAGPALAAAPTASNFGPGGTLYNSGSNPPLVFSVLPHVTGAPTSFAMVSTTSDMGGTVNITNAGTITYVPPVGFKGTDWVYYTASNADGTSAPATVHISVNWPVITVVTPSNSAAVGVPYNPGGTPLAISGGQAPYTITFSDPFPAGMSFNPATNVISGAPTSAGGYAVNYSLTDSSFGQTGPHTINNWLTFNIDPPTITVSPPTLGGSPTIGTAYSQTLTASGGAAPYSYAVTAGALPAGLSLSVGGVVSGTPTAAGAFNATVRAMDNSGYTGSRTYNFTVAAPPMILTAAPMPGGNVGTPYATSVTASGATAPYSYQVTAGALPAGLSLSASGAISGTPTTGGTFNFTITATDSSTGTNAPFAVGGMYAINITAPTVAVAPGGLFDAQIGQAYSAAITASGAQAPYSFAVTAGALPAGLSLSLGGALTGAPTASGAFNFTVTATDSNGFPATGSRAYSLSVLAPNLSLQPGLLPNATFGETFSASFAGGGGSSPYSYQVTVGALPAGLTLTPTGLLSGTPTVQGTFNFTVTTTDSTTGAGPYSLAQAYSLLVAPPPPPIAGPAALTLAANSPGQPVVLTLGGGTATGVAVGAVTPAHGTLNIAGLTMTYIPDPGYSGPDSFTYTAFNITGHSPEETVSVTVTPPTLTLSALPTAGQVTAPYSGTAAASLGTAPYSFVQTAGALPTGITLAANGMLSGTPTGAGTFNFTLEATDAYGATGTRAYTVTIDAPTVAITAPATGALPGVEAGTAYSETFTASGGQGAHSFSVTAGALPPGVTLSAAGVLSGAPTTPGTFNFSVTPRDSSTAPGPYVGAALAYSLTVSAPTITVNPSTLPAAATATAYGATIVASGGVGAYDYAVTAGALPAGLSLSNGGALSGTLTASGTFNFTVTATDSFGFTGVRAFSVTVADPTVSLTAPAAGALPQGVVGTTYSRTFTASGGQGPHSFVLAGGALPTGLALSSSGVLSGAPTALGAFAFSVRAIDGSAAPGPFSSPAVNYTLQIAPPTIAVAPAAGALPSGLVATPYSQAFSASGGAAPYGFAVTAGTLPVGLSLSAGGTLSGTPTGTGTFNFTITATDSSPGPAGPFSASQAYSVAIQPPTLVLDPSAGALPSAAAGVAYGQTFTAGGGTGPYSYTVTAGALPTGLTLSAGGVLSGAPLVEGTFNFTVVANDSTTGIGAPYTLAQAYSLVVDPPVPPVAGAALLTLPANSPGEPVTLDLSGGAATSVAVATPPAHGTTSIAGLTITYIPTAGFSGPDSFTYTATNSGGTSAPATASVTVTPPTLTLSAAPATGQVTVPYGATITAALGSAPYRFETTAGARPPGLTLATDGALSGAPTAAGVFNFTVKATDANGAIGTRAYTLNIDAPGIAITSPAAGPLPGAAAGTAYAATFTASGGQGAHSFSVTAGALPPGMTLSSAGLLSGVPNAAGTFNFVVTPADSSVAPGPYSGTPKSYSLTVAAPAITLNPGALPPAVTATPYSVSITATGGVRAYGYAVTAGALPPGLSLSGAGLLSGAPTASGAFNFTIEATDGLGFTGTRAFSVTVSSPVIAVTAPAAGALPAGVGGTAYSQTFTATGGQGTHSFVLAGGTLPAGLTLSSAGVLSGTPTAAGSFTFAVLATDASPAPGPFSSVAVSYTLEVAAPTVTLSPAAGALPGGLITVVYSQAFSANGGTAPYAFAVTAGALPDGLTLSAAGLLSGTAAAAGSNGFSVTATDAYGFADTQAYTLEIGTPVPVVTPKTATVIGGQSVTIAVTDGAVGVGLTSVAVASPPSHGTAVVSGMTIVYTAESGYSGADSFTYTVSNAGGASLPGTVTITVNPAIAAGPPKEVTILAGQTAVVELTEGATGAPFAGAAVVSLSPAEAGTATIAARTGPSGQLYDLTFKPDNSFTGQATVLYTLSNAFATSAPGTVTITVEARPDPGQDPEVAGLIAAQSEAARRFATAQISNINRRLERLHDGSGDTGGGFSSAVSLGFGSATASTMPSDPSELRRMQDSFGVIGALTGRNDLGFDRGGPSSRTEDLRTAGPGGGDGAGPWGVWVSGAANFGTADDGRDREGFEFSTDGLSIGADRRLGDAWVVGGAVGWAIDTSRIGDNGTRSEADSWSLALYGSYQPAEKVYVDLVLGYGRLDFDSRRYVTANGDFAYGQRNGDQWFGALTAGWDYRHPHGLKLSPYGRIEATRSVLDAFTEEGGGVFALAYDEQETTTVTGALGVRGDYAFKTRFGQAIPSFRIEYAYDLQGTGTARLRYADWLDGAVYELDASPLDKNRMLYGLGLDLMRKSGMRLGLDYEGMLSGDQTSQTVRIMLETPF